MIASPFKRYATKLGTRQGTCAELAVAAHLHLLLLTKVLAAADEVQRLREDGQLLWVVAEATRIEAALLRAAPLAVQQQARNLTAQEAARDEALDGAQRHDDEGRAARVACEPQHPHRLERRALRHRLHERRRGRAGHVVLHEAVGDCGGHRRHSRRRRVRGAPRGVAVHDALHVAVLRTLVLHTHRILHCAVSQRRAVDEYEPIFAQRSLTQRTARTLGLPLTQRLT